jgi:hypothetical protein
MNLFNYSTKLYNLCLSPTKKNKNSSQSFIKNQLQENDHYNASSYYNKITNQGQISSNYWLQVGFWLR